MNCSSHSSRPAVYECDNCGQPICESCYNTFELPNGAHVCSNCYKEAVRDEIAEVNSLKGMVKREFIFIIVGLIVGLGIGLYFLIGALASDSGMRLEFIPLVIYLPFLFGSLMTIIKKIKNEYSDARVEGDDTNWISLIMIIIVNLLIAPIMTIMRFCQRIGDMRKLNRIAQNDQTLLVNIDEYLAQSNRPSTVAASANGEAADEEISLDSILAAGGGSEAALCDNGEILRTVRTR